MRGGVAEDADVAVVLESGTRGEIRPTGLSEPTGLLAADEANGDDPTGVMGGPGGKPRRRALRRKVDRCCCCCRFCDDGVAGSGVAPTLPMPILATPPLLSAFMLMSKSPPPPPGETAKEAEAGLAEGVRRSTVGRKGLETAPPTEGLDALWVVRGVVDGLAVVAAAAAAPVAAVVEWCKPDRKATLLPAPEAETPLRNPLPGAP